MLNDTEAAAAAAACFYSGPVQTHTHFWISNAIFTLQSHLICVHAGRRVSHLSITRLCLQHNVEFETYDRARSGLPCCCECIQLVTH